MSEHQSALEHLNELAQQFAPLIECANVVFTFLIGIGLALIAWQANKIANSNVKLAEESNKISSSNMRLVEERSRDRGWAIKSDERATFKSNYEKVSKALGIVMREGTVDAEALAQFWQARDEARLELPTEISEYTQQLFDKMHAAFRHKGMLNADGALPIGPERSEVAKEHSRIVRDLIKEEPYSVYSKYLKYKE